MITYDDFAKVDIRAGKIIGVDDFPEARKAAYKLRIDFGREFGIKTSSAQITHHYSKDDLLGKTVLAVTNLPPKQIGHFVSECLVLGFPDENDEIVMAFAEPNAPLGSKIC